MKQRMRLSIAFLLVFKIVMPALAEPLPLRPGDSFSRMEIFLIQHRDMKENQEIMDFINTCGISDFQEIDVNRTHTYVYVFPKENCSNKLVFLERSGEIIWVRQIGMNETIPFKAPEPLDDLFSAYPAIENNETISSFIETYAPKKWKKTQMNRNSSLVYLISENEIFKELMFLETNGSIVQVEIFDESRISMNRTRALEIAGNRINSSKSPEDIQIVFSGSEALWAVTYMEGFTATTLFVDTDNGELYYFLSEPEEKSEKSLPESSPPEVPGFTGELILTVILGVAWTLDSGRLSKK